MTPLLDPLPITPTSLPHADSSLSSTLISTLASLLPYSPALILSVGYGHGVLEAYLQSCSSVNFLGVDVAYQLPQYLPEERTCILPGIYATSAEALEAEAWIFVYPKDLGLLGKYLRDYGEGKVRIIIWIGPRLDWELVEMGIPMEDWKREVPERNGLKDYEALIVWRKNNAGE